MPTAGRDIGAHGGTVTAHPTSAFDPVVMREPFQQYIERNLVLNQHVPVDRLPSRSYRYPVTRPTILDAGKAYSPRVEPGGEFPLVNVGGDDVAEGHISGAGYAARIDIEAQNDPGRINKLRNAMLNWAADFFEKKAFELITGATLDWSAFTTSSTWTDGGQFDAFLGTRMNGGYSTAVATTNTLMIGNNDGYYWDSDDGNPVDDLHRVLNVLEDQNRAAGSNSLESQTTTVPWDLSKTVMLLDSISYGAIFSHLMEQNKFHPMVSVSGSEMIVPELFGVRFVKANRALPIGTIDVAGNGSGYGIAIMYQEDDVPFRGYQWFPNTWPGWSRAGTVTGKWDFLSYNDRIRDMRGLFEVGFWTSLGISVHNPQKLAIWGGMRSYEGF